MTISTLSHSEISINDDILPTPSNSTTTLSSSAYPIHLHNNDIRDGDTIRHVLINELGEDVDEPWRLDPIINYASKQRDYFFMDRDENSNKDCRGDTQCHSDKERCVT